MQVARTRGCRTDGRRARGYLGGDVRALLCFQSGGDPGPRRGSGSAGAEKGPARGRETAGGAARAPRTDGAPDLQDDTDPHLLPLLD